MYQISRLHFRKILQLRSDIFQQLALSAFEENVKYLEVRFAPSFSTAQGLSICEIVESVQKGLQKAHEKTGIYSGIIVCGMRNLDMDTNI
ncbi:MAG: hypothetical protein IKC88_03490, partial [Opitutales bacterium]|nr:hypothetical protein [Opitutales bacterium]